MAYVLISPCDPPREIVLQWNAGGWDWNHRGYWGTNSFPYGTDGTDSLRRMGDMPATGQWVRLEIPASQIGLENRTLSGVSFDLAGGKAWFDRVGKAPAGSGELMVIPTSMASSYSGPAAEQPPQQLSRRTRLRAWLRRLFLRREAAPPVALLIDSEEAVVQPLDAGQTKNMYSLYTPELSLMAETTTTTATNPPIAYEYVWFAGQPVAQIENATSAVHSYFNDHLGTPILTTDSSGTVDWRMESEPYGKAVITRAGADRHQPLGFPGQENQGDSEVTYNIFRWYRVGWGRYTQADPMGARARSNSYSYANDNSTRRIDRLGLFDVDPSCKACGQSPDAAKRLRDDGEARCRMVDSIITDVALADCIKGKCRTAKVDCLDPTRECQNDHTAGGYAPYGGNEVHMCPDNWPSNPWPGLVGNMLLHEFAHSCNWCHGDGHGVPYDPGPDRGCWRDW